MSSKQTREQDFLNAVLENAGALVVVLGHEGRIRRFNRACENLSGLRFAEVEGRFPWETFLPPEDAESVKKLVFEALAHNPQSLAGHYTNHWLTRDGRRRLTEWSNTLLLDDQGRTEFVVCVGADITERHCIEQQMQLKDAALEYALNAIAISDPDGRLTYVNPAFLKMWGYRQASEALGRHASEFWVQPELAVAIIQALQQQGEWTGTREGLRADGRHFIAEMMAVLFRDTSGKSMHMFASFLDVTDRVRAEQALRTNEQRLRYAEQMTHVGTWERDLITDEGWWSNEQYQLMGIDRTNGPVPQDTFLNLVHPDDRETINKAYQELFAKGSFEGDFRVVRPDGKLRHIHSVVMTHFDDAGQPLRLIGANLDITERKNTESVLRQSEARLRHAQAIASVGSWELDLANDALIWSEETCRIFGRDPQCDGGNYEMFLNAIHPDDRDAVHRAYQDSVAHRTPYDFTHRIVLPDGTLKWVQERGETLYDERGQPLRTIGAVQDITERMRTEAALRTTNQIVSAVLDTTPVLIAYLDTDMNFVRVNRAYAEADGKTPDYFIGKNHFALFPHADNEAIFRRVAETGVAHTVRAKAFEYEHAPERGVTHWDWTLTPITDDAGAVTGLVLSLLNVTDRVQALETAQRSEQLLATLMNNLQGLVYRCQNDPNWTMTYMSSGSTALTGYEPADFMERARIHYADLIHPDDQAMVWDQVQVGVRQHAPYFLTYRIRARDGREKWVWERGQGVFGAGGELLYLEGLIVDMTEQKRIEAELEHHRTHLEELVQTRTAALERAKEDAERANRAKSDFLSRMSHELRTPMNAILGFTQVLGMEHLRPEHQEFVDEIAMAGEHLLVLINELLDLARIESGRLTATIEPVALAPVAVQAIHMVQPLLTQHRLTLHNLCEPDIVLLADTMRLRQILVNLLSNAAKYNRTGGIIRVECQPAAQDRVRITVSDTGPGIAPEQQARLFMPFERLGAERSGIDGTGIGLALCRRLAELMGGEMGFESAPGQGSKFWLELSRVEGAPAVAPIIAQAASTPDPRARHRVLYIEDNTANLRVVEAMLRHRPDITLLTATNGEFGLELVHRYRPELVLLDIHLPDMDGYAVLEAMRADPETRAIPVVALSADAMPIDIETGQQAGFGDYLTKPVKTETLLATLDRYLGGPGN